MEKEFIQEPINSNSEEINEINNSDNFNDDTIKVNKNNLIKKIIIFTAAILLIIFIISIVIILAKTDFEKTCALKEVKDENKIYTCNYTNGDIYEGELLNGEKHGKGAYKWHNNNNFYIGEWKRNIRDSEGIFVWNKGDMYLGSWKDYVKTRHCKNSSVIQNSSEKNLKFLYQI